MRRKRPYISTPESRAKAALNARIWRAKNPEKQKAIAKRNYENNKDKIQVRNSKRYLRKRTEILAKMKDRYWEDPQKYRDRKKKESRDKRNARCRLYHHYRKMMKSIK